MVLPHPPTTANICIFTIVMKKGSNTPENKERRKNIVKRNGGRDAGFRQNESRKMEGYAGLPKTLQL